MAEAGKCGSDGLAAGRKKPTTTSVSFFTVIHEKGTLRELAVCLYTHTHVDWEPTGFSVLVFGWVFFLGTKVKL